MSEVPDYIERIDTDDDTAVPPVEIPEGATTATLSQKFLELKQNAERAEEERKAFNVELELVERQLVALMDKQKLDKFSSHGYTFFTKVEPKPHVKHENLEAFMVWLDENGHGAIAKRSVHYQTLKAWVAHQMEANKEVPKLVDVFMKTAVRTRKQNNKK